MSPVRHRVACDIAPRAGLDRAAYVLRVPALERSMTTRLLLFLLLPLTLLACGDAEDACEEGAYTCDGDTLQVCDADGAYVDDTDCAALGLMCHAEMGHCMDMSGDDSGM